MENSNAYILMPTDFEEQSMVALNYAAYFAQLSQAELVIMTVMEESALLKRLASTEEEKNKLMQTTQDLLDAKAEKIKQEYPDLKIATRIESGKPYEQIAAVADEIKPHLILMGKSEMSKIKRAFVGSNTMHLVRETNYPVITITGKGDIKEYKNLDNTILLPLDLGKIVKEQVSAAIEFAHFLSADIQLVSILRSDSAGTEVQYLTQLNKIQKTFEAENIKCTFELVKNSDDDVADVLTDYAEKSKSRLIVVMTQDEAHLVDYFIGSNAQEIIAKSTLPVLSVVPWNEDHPNKLFQTIYDPLNIF